MINGQTIRQEEGARSVRYFHVELETHAILLAEGMPTESYLDTGNRGFFINGGATLITDPDLEGTGAVTRESNSCAPFRCDEPTVRPIWRRLADRALLLGHVEATRETSTNPDFVLAAGDRPVRPAYVEQGRHVFVVPAGVSRVRLRSRAASPTDCRPWLGDHRKLGISVHRIVLRGGHGVAEVPLDHPDLSDGWWAPEQHGGVLTRWTDGDALLPIPAPHASGASVLEIHLGGDMVYPAIPGDLGLPAAASLPA